MAEPLRTLIVDDEPLAVDRLRRLIEPMPDVIVVGEARDGAGAVELARATRADLILLDIAMPGMDGIDVARALADSPLDPAVVFVTAFDNFAVAAFDVAAVDYLMKPVEPARLEQELDPARFIRVHRSVILRRDTILGLTRDRAGHWAARLAGGGEQRIGRSYVDDVKRLARR